MSEFVFVEDTAPDPDIVSMVRTSMNERCTGCRDWAGPTWTVTWRDGRTEIRCAIHGGRDQ